jgi:hypothetical protein
MGKQKKKAKLAVDTTIACDRRRVVITPQTGIEHAIFVNVPADRKVDEYTERGIRVMVAKHPDFYRLYLYRYMLPNSPGYPRGGVKVWNDTDEQMQSYHYESVILHPDGGKRRFTMEMLPTEEISNQ